MLNRLIQSGAVGAGTYLSDVPVTFTQERQDQLVSHADDAVANVQKIGRESSLRTFNNPNGTFSQPDMYTFASDRNGTCLANPYLFGIIGMNRLFAHDLYGEYPVTSIIANAEQGGGFTYYFFADPAEDYRVHLNLMYSRRVDDDLIVGAGILP